MCVLLILFRKYPVIGRIGEALLTRLSIKCVTFRAITARADFRHGRSAPAIGETRQSAGDSAVVRSMDGVHEVMISSDTRVYARSARCTYPDTIGERPRIINSDIPSGNATSANRHQHQSPVRPRRRPNGGVMNIDTTVNARPASRSVRAEATASKTNTHTYPLPYRGKYRFRAIKFVIKVVASRH